MTESEVEENWKEFGSMDKLFSNLKCWDDVLPQMEKLTKDGEVRKHILKSGHLTTGKVKEDCLVRLHYTIQLENSKKPFDSSLDRKDPAKIDIKKGMLPGMEIGVLSMMKKEIAILIIEPSHGYGRKGIPPRIPPNTRILVTLEVVDFYRDGSADKVLASDDEEGSFSDIYKISLKELKNGNRFYKQNDCYASTLCYKKGIQLLNKCSLRNEEDQEKQQHVLYKLYLNQAACSLKLQRPAETCYCCREALQIQPKEFRPLYLFGRAKLMLEDYDAAISMLQKALTFRPDDLQIRQRLQAAYEEKIEREKVYQCNFYSIDEKEETGDSNNDEEETNDSNNDEEETYDSDNDKTLCETDAEDKYETPECSITEENHSHPSRKCYPRATVDVKLTGRKLVYNKDKKDAFLQDLSFQDIIHIWGGSEEFALVLRDLLIVEILHVQDYESKRIPIQVDNATRRIISPVVQSLGLNLSYRKEGNNVGSFSFIVSRRLK